MPRKNYKNRRALNNLFSKRIAIIFVSLFALIGTYFIYQSYAATSTVSRLQIGVVPDLTWATSTAEQDRTIKEMKSAGVKWVRLSVNWFDAEPSAKGSYNQYWIDTYTRAIQQSNQAGISVLVVVDGSPLWANGTNNVHTPPRNPQDLTDFTRFLAAKYKGQVYGYEIWNEQNTSRFWSSGPNPAAYTTVLKAGYNGVKSGDPNAKVLYGGTSTSDYDFLNGVYSAGGKGYFDILATHPYTYCTVNSPDTVNYTSNGRISRDSYTGYRELRKTMLAYGDDKPIWFTEMGWSTTTQGCNPGAGQWVGGVSEATQAQYLTRAFQIAQQDPYVEVALWYNFRNNYWSKDADEGEARFGLVRTDFTHKPVFDSFKSFAEILGQFSVTTDTSPPAPTAQDLAPVVKLTSPINNINFTSSLFLSANATDDKGVAKVEFYDNDRLLNTDTSAPYTFNWRAKKNVAYGLHTITAVAYDAAGHSAQSSVNVTRVR